MRTDLGQPKHRSLVEALVNVLVGYGVAVTAQVVLFPIWGISIPLKSNLEIGLAMTVVSIVRSYLLRRAFNAYDINKVTKGF